MLVLQAGLTGGCWSLSRPSFVFTSCEDGTIQCWNLLAGGNSPIQKQNTSGAATVIIIIVCVLVIVFHIQGVPIREPFKKKCGKEVCLTLG